jgi:hypothetical protein
LHFPKAQRQIKKKSGKKKFVWESQQGLNPVSTNFNQYQVISQKVMSNVSDQKIEKKLKKPKEAQFYFEA